MDIEARFPRKYISALDILDGDADVTIESVAFRDITPAGGGDSESKPVVVLTQPIIDGGPNHWILNKTNVRTIKALVGSGEPEDWAGQTITLFKTTVSVGKEVHDAVRVRAQLPSVHTLQNGEDIPF